MPLVDGVYQYTTADAASPSPSLLNRLGDSVRTLLNTAHADTGWQALTLGASWAYIGGGSYGTASHRLRRGLVHLSGVLKTTGATGALSTVGTLPVGERPPVLLRLVVPIGAGSGLIQITTAGLIQCDAAQAAGQSLSLDGVTFVPGV